MIDLDALKAEIDKDPLNRGYSGMDDAAAAADLNTVYRTRPRGAIPTWEVAAAMDDAALVKVDAAGNEKLKLILSAPRVQISEPRVQGILSAVFTSDAAAKQRFIDLQTDPVSRAVELGLPPIKVGWVGQARAL